MRTTWSIQIHIFSLVALKFILQKTITESKRPPGYQRGNVFGCPCGNGIEGRKKLSINKSKLDKLENRVVNGFDPNERAWMVFMKTKYSGVEKMYE